MTTITQTRLKCDWCDAVSPIIGDEQPLGWVNTHELNFCTVEHQELYFDKLYAKSKIKPIICSYCDKRLPCNAPEFHHGHPMLASYGRWRITHHPEWWYRFQESEFRYFCTHDHLDLWWKEQQ